MKVLLLQSIVVISATACLAYGIAACNRMTRETHHGVRLAFICMSTGAFGLLMAVFATDYVPSIAEGLFAVGVGLLTMFGRREHFKCPYGPKQRPAPDFGRRWQDSLIEPDILDDK